MRVIFEVIEGPHCGDRFVFEEYASFVVGRHRKSQFYLSRKDPTLSRFHFSVEVAPPRCTLYDLGSTNSTRVNGERVDRAELRDGDLIRAGMSTLRVVIEGGGEGGPDLPPPDPEALQSIGHFRIERKLGEGTSGFVYLAADEHTGARVALKLVPAASAITGNPGSRSAREAVALGHLRHENIINLYEVGRAEPWLFLAMEYVPGPDALRLVLNRGRALPVGQAVDLTRQVLSALGHAHAKGVVHRDVKPNNIIVTRTSGREVAKLGDFGLAKLYRNPGSGFQTLTRKGDQGGTPGFLAPEQINDLSQAGPPADLYGAGATLYFLLTGRVPFDFPADVQECLRMIYYDDPVPVCDVRPDLPEDLADVVDKALARDPEQRFADAEAMRQALTPWAAWGDPPG